MGSLLRQRGRWIIIPWYPELALHAPIYGSGYHNILGMTPRTLPLPVGHPDAMPCSTVIGLRHELFQCLILVLRPLGYQATLPHSLGRGKSLPLTIEQRTSFTVSSQRSCLSLLSVARHTSFDCQTSGTSQLDRPRRPAFWTRILPPA
jgi:hypothetical protein